MPRKSDVPSRIVRAANIALFSRQGYHRTSTRDIARLADVSEVTLYRYFEHKEDVFWAAPLFVLRHVEAAASSPCKNIART